MMSFAPSLLFCGRPLPNIILIPHRQLSLPHNRRFGSCARRHAEPRAQVPFRRDANGVLLSRVDGVTEPPLVQHSLYAHWRKLANQYSAGPALISKHEPSTQHDLDDGRAERRDADDCLRWTYLDLNAHIDALALGLVHKLDIRPGDRVGVLMGNSSAYLALQWALAKVGAILVPLNPAYAPDELGRSLAHVGARVLILVPSLKNADYTQHLLKILPGLAQGRSEGQSLNAQLLPKLERVVLVDNITSRPKTGWERTSVLARQGWSFSDALDSLHGRAIDYRSLLLEAASTQLASDDVEKQLDSKDVINLQLTSGTTGLPKAVALTSWGMLNNGISIGQVLHLRADDIVLNNPPLFHCFGLTLGNLAAQTHGSCLLYAAETFDPARTLAAVTEEKATVLHGVPAMFFGIMDLLAILEQKSSNGGRSRAEADPNLAALGLYDRLDIKTLRTGLISGASIPVELMSRLLDKLVPGLTSVYGMTESSPVSFGCDAETTSVQHKAQTVGRVFPHVHAKIVTPQTSAAQQADGTTVSEAERRGTPLPVKTPGELCTAGYLVMNGYYNDAARTAEVMGEYEDEEGIVWLRTGDIASMDEQGWVTIVGRAKDVIIRGGENLFPATICNCIDELDGVGQSAVVAVPDERLGETVGVFVKRSQDEAGPHLQRHQIHEHVKGRLSHQNAPEWVWMLGEDGVDDELPKTASGKVQNVVLRAWAKNLAARGIGRPSRPRRAQDVEVKT